MVLDGFLDPAAGYAEQHPPVRQMIKRCDGLGGDDRVALGQETDAGAEQNALGDGGTGRQCRDRIVHARKRLDDVRAVVFVLAMHYRHMAVLGEEQHVEATVLDRARQRYRRQGQIGRQQANAKTRWRIHTRAG